MEKAKSCVRALLVVVVLCVTGLLVGGCDDTPQPSAPEGGKANAKPEVGVLLYKKDDVYISLVAEAMEAAFAEKALVTVESAQNDQLTQDEQIEMLLNKKIDALVVNLVETQAAATIVDKAKKAGIPVVFFNREPDTKILTAYDKARFIGTNTADAGKMQGDIIKKLWENHSSFDRNQDGQFQYVMIQGNTDNPEAIARTEYSVRQAQELGVIMRQIGETYVCNWDEALARQSMQLAIAANGAAIELVIANSDAMALGAIAALSEHGYNKEGGDPAKFIPVVGVDATPQAIAAIQKGIMSATVKQDAQAMGQAIAAFVLNSVNGKDFLAGTPYAWDVSGVAVRIPYSPYSNEQ